MSYGANLYYPCINDKRTYVFADSCSPVADLEALDGRMSHYGGMSAIMQGMSNDIIYDWKKVFSKICKSEYHRLFDKLWRKKWKCVLNACGIQAKDINHNRMMKLLPKTKEDLNNYIYKINENPICREIFDMDINDYYKILPYDPYNLLDGSY